MKNFKSIQVGAKLSPDFLDTLNYTFEQITGSDKPLTFREYVEVLHARAMAAQAPAPLYDEHNNALDQAQINDIIAARNDYYNNLTDAKHKLNSIQSQLMQSKLSDNQLILNCEPLELHLANELAKIESTRTNKEVQPENIFKSLFNHQLFYGPGDWLPKKYSKDELKALKRKLEAPATIKPPPEPEAEAETLINESETTTETATENE